MDAGASVSATLLGTALSEQKANASNDAVMETGNTMQNHSTLSGVDTEMVDTEIGAKNSSLSGVFKGRQLRDLIPEDSSDSEGPLPEIDLGLSSEGEEDKE